MKRHMNPPSNTEAFNEHFGQYAAAKGAMALGTLLCIITEVAILNSLIKSLVVVFMPNTPSWLIFLLATTIVLLLAKERYNYAMEFAKIVLSLVRVGKSIKLDPNKTLGWASTINTTLIFVAVFACSGLISYLGSITMVTDAYVPPKIQTTEQEDKAAREQVAALNEQFSKDSAIIANSYKSQQEAITGTYKTKIDAAKSETKRKSWLRRKNNSKIKGLEEERNAKIAELKQLQSETLTDLGRRKVETIQSINKTTSDTKVIVSERNKTKEVTSAYLYERAKTWFPNIVMISLFLIVLGAITAQTFMDKAGIKEVIIPSEHELKPSIASEFYEAFSSYFQSILRVTAFKIKSASWKSPDLLVDDLLRINLKEYNEKNVDVGGNNKQSEIQFGAAPAPQISQTKDVEEEVNSLVDVYRINRQQYNIYVSKGGNPDTVSAGLTRHANAMIAAEQKINALGYKLKVTKNKIYAEKE